MGRLERRHLESFIAAAESGSVIAAAARLHLSPSGVSKSIAHFERLLSYLLFERTADGVVLLPAGKRLLSPARLVLSTMNALEDGATGHVRGEEAGEDLHLVCAPSLAPDPLSGIVGEYLQQHRGQRVFIDTLREPELESIVELVMTGHYDVGITETPRAEIPGLVVSPMADAEFWAVLPPGAGEAVDGEITTDQLIQAGLVVSPHWESSEVHRQLVAMDSRIRSAITVRSPHRGMFLAFVIAGLGAVFLRSSQAPLAASAGCAIGPVSGLRTRRLAILHREHADTESIRQFIAVCQHYRPV